MTENKMDSQDRLEGKLLRAVMATKAGSFRASPSAELQAATLERIEAEAARGHTEQATEIPIDSPPLTAKGTPRSPRRWWPAVSIPLTAAAAIVLLVLLWTGRSGPLPASNLAWAQVAKQLQKLQSYSYLRRDTIKLSDGKVIMQLTRNYFRAPDQYRHERISVSAATRPAPDAPAKDWILKNATGHPYSHVLQGDPDGYGDLSRSARRVSVDEVVMLRPVATRRSSTFGDEFFITHLRDLDPNKVTRQGEEKQPDGRTLLRFETTSDVFYPDEPKSPVTVWVDPKTSLPVRCLLHLQPAHGAQNVTIEMTDVRFDPPLDEKLFALPDLESQPVDWRFMVAGPVGATWDQTKVVITGPDGRPMVTADDFVFVTHAGRDSVFRLKPESEKRLRERCAANVGKELTIQVGDAPVRKLTILGPVSQFQLLLTRSDVPTTQNSLTPTGASGRSTPNTPPRAGGRSPADQKIEP